MSQHIVQIDDKKEAQIGWDQQMETFYAQVYKTDDLGDRISAEDGGNIVWVGTRHYEIYDLEDFIGRCNRLGIRLDRAMQAQLYADRDEGC